MTITLAICFYNDLEILLRTLESVAAQSRLPDELVIADDGSDEALGALIARWANDRRMPLIHVWHPKDGFRQGEMRNKAACIAGSEFVAFIDHDCLLPRGFIHSHLNFASERHLQLGPRIDVMPPATATFRPTPVPMFRALVAKRLYGWREAARANSMRTAPPGVIEGCNLLVPKSVLTAINGFDQEFKNWGYEDAEFLVRAWHAGFGIGLTGWRTSVFHLHHPTRANSTNRPLFEQSVREKRTRCANGISRHEGAALARTVDGFYTRAAFSY